MADVLLNTPTGITAEAFDKMIQGAGGAYLSLPLKGGETAEEVSDILQAAVEAGQVLGTTRGGFDFDYGFDTTDIEADGKLFPFKGSTQMTKMNAEVSTILLTWDPKTLAAVFGNHEWDQALQKMGFRMQFTNNSYLDEVWFVFALIGGGYVAHKLINVLNTNGSTPTSDNEGQMEIPVTLVAHQGSLTDSQYGPVEMYWFLPEGKEIDPVTLEIIDSASTGAGASAPVSAAVSTATATSTKTTAKK